jgi:hypothetical protein
MHRFCLAAAVPLAVLGVSPAALAHAVCGARVFPVTLTIDDPGVSDELSLPTFSFINNAAAGSREYDFEMEWDKTITPNFGVGVATSWNIYDNRGDGTRSGWGNLDLSAKYSRCLSEDHEFMLALGVDREMGRTGTAATGADDYGSTSPTVYFGKGFGDLPTPWLRPLAITGEFSYTIADKALKATPVVDPDSGLMSLQYNSGNPNQYFGGFSVQYSLPYLQSQVKDYGLPSFIGRLTPLVEVTWTSPATAPSQQGTTWTVAPGVIYSADWYQLGLELLIPANKAAGSNVGVIAQFHMFLDDLLPDSVLGRPLFP